MLTTNLAIVAPVTEADDRTAREAVWQQVTERIVPQMGKLCTRFEPSGGAWGQKVSSPYSVILGRNEPALFLYFYASAKHQLDERAKAHLAGFMEHLEIGNEQTVGDTKMCTAYLKGDTAEARSHMEWHIANMFGELMPDCGIYFLREGRSYLSEAEHKRILCNMKDYAIGEQSAGYVRPAVGLRRSAKRRGQAGEGLRAGQSSHARARCTAL